MFAGVSALTRCQIYSTARTTRKNSNRRRRGSRRATQPMTNYGRIQDRMQLGLIGATEVKHVDYSISNYPVSTTPPVFLLTGISQGVSANQRVGNVIFIKSIHVELFLNVADATNFVKTYLLLCQNGQAGSAAFSNWSDPPDSDQYIILKDKLTSLNTALNDTSCVKFQHRFPGKGLMVRYDTQSTTSEIFNRITLTMISDSSAAPHPTVSGYVRTFFTDP